MLVYIIEFLFNFIQLPMDLNLMVKNNDANKSILTILLFITGFTSNDNESKLNKNQMSL